MGSPFATFRKYDKVLLAVFGVLIIFAFLVGDSLSLLVSGQSGSRSGERADTVVTYTGGAISGAQLLVMHRADQLADVLLMKVVEATQKKNATPRPFPETPQRFFRQPHGEQWLVRNVLLAQKAHELGMSLSDDDIDRLLRQVSNEALTKADIEKLRNELLEDERGTVPAISSRELYAQLRINFLAQQMLALVRNSTTPLDQDLQMALMGFGANDTAQVTPAQAWEYFRRTSQMVTAELLPLDVEKFVDEVKGTPTAKQLDELFEKHKATVPVPLSPEPGFAHPQKIAFGYVEVNFEPFLVKAKAELTTEQLRAEYEKRVEQGEFVVPVLPNKEGDPEKKPEEKPAEPKPEPSEEKKPEEEKPTEEKPAEEPTEEKPSDEKPSEEKPAEDLKTLENEPIDDEQVEETPAEQPAAEKPEETKPAETKPAETKPEEKKPEEPKKEEKRTKTFEEVEKDLRNQLAQKPAEDARREAIDAVQAAVSMYQAAYKKWEEEKATAAQKKQPAPEQPELATALRSILKKYDFQYKQTPLLDRFELSQDSVLGKSSMIDPRGQLIPLDAVYNAPVENFDVQIAQGGEPDTIELFWKEQDEPQRVAERKESEAALLKAWKMQKAFDLAKTEAQRLADAAKGKENLRAAFPTGVEKAGAIVTPAPFSWLTSGVMPMGMQQLQMTRIPEAPYVGEEFMQTATSLAAGEYGIAPDQGHRKVYVIHVLSQSRSESVQRSLFMLRGLADPNISRQYNADRIDVLDRYLANLNTQYNVNWRRDPIQFER